MKPKCSATCSAAKRKSAGAVAMTARTLPAAPTTAKKICRSSAASKLPAGASAPRRFGNAVASATTAAVTSGISAPDTPSARAPATDAAQMHALVASANAALVTLTPAAASSPAGGGAAVSPLPPEDSVTPAASAKRLVKYSAQIKLSAASPAATSEGVMPRYSHTAT